MLPKLTKPCILPFCLILLSTFPGCTSFRDYVRNGFKVGPNYCPPQAEVAEDWLDAADLRTSDDKELIGHWWTVFNDAKLNQLVNIAYRQNLSLREAGCRVLQARAQLAITSGYLWPQQQGAFGDYRRSGSAVDPDQAGLVSRFRDSWDFGFNLGWELDFWGRFRRAIAAAEADLEASVAYYDAVLVTLLGDVAENYLRVRTDQERIKLLTASVQLQRGVLNFIENRLQAGFRVTELDRDQALSNLRQTEAAIPPLKIELRQAQNRLCILLGMPPSDIQALLGEGPIPKSPPEVALGIPADLLRRRPDVRRAERMLAAQAEQIGIAEADLYPAFSISGTLGYQARNFPDLFRESSFNGSVGPSFQWNLLNYGRILNNVRLQEAGFQELLYTYQNTVLQANEEVENGLVTFLQAQRRTKLLDESVAAARSAVKIVITQYEEGAVDFNRYATIEQNLVTQQDQLAQAQGQIAQGLIAVYRALGGGWELRLSEEEAPPPAAPTEMPEELPAPPAGEEESNEATPALESPAVPQPEETPHSPADAS